MPNPNTPSTGENSVYLRFAGQPIRIQTDTPLNLDSIEEMCATVTEMTVDQSDDQEAVSPSIVFTEEEEINVKYDKVSESLHITGPARNFGQGIGLVYLAEYLAACTLAEKQGKFLTHAAAIYDPSTDRSQLLFGEKGAGKTTLAIRACKEGGRQIIGNDQVYIGSTGNQITTSGGNAWFHVRRTAVDSDDYLKEILNTATFHDGKSTWNNKIKLTAEQLEIPHKLGQTTVGRIFNIRIDPTQKGLYAARWYGVQQNLILHEKLGRHISGQATPLQDDKGNYLGSLPLIKHEITMRRRDELVRQIGAVGVTEVFAPDGASAISYLLGRNS